MLRYVAAAIALCAAPAFAQDLQTGPSRAPHAQNDRFIIANDDCGASQYARLIGRSYEIYRTALPRDAIVHGGDASGAVNVSHRVQRATQPTTLEFRPQQLNVVVDASARILSVGCY